MKKTLLSTLILIGLSVVLTCAQAPKAQRLVLAEEFTNACCAPCASQNPGFDALLSANPNKITSIKYHVNWPGPDPMNQQNTQDVGTRVTYYSVSGVPYCRQDGVAPAGSYYLGAPANLTQSMIDAAFALPSNYEIQLYQYIPPTNDSIYVTMLVHCVLPDSGQLVAHIVVIEKHIHFATAPGTNGETDFYNVVKKMLPTRSGTALPSKMVAGDYVIIQSSWKLASVYNVNELAVVGFVQSNSTKNVRQAVNGSNNPVIPIYSNDACVMAISNVPVNSCTGSISPVVTIRNNGNQPLTSLLFSYTVNGGTPSTYQWNGNLETLKTTDVALPAITYELAANNPVIVTTSNPNGAADEYTKNDSYSTSFKQAPTVYRKMNLHLMTDNSPAQTTWEIRDELGALITSSGTLTQANHEYAFPIQIPGGGCYSFIINDAGGDGLCCSNGYGYFQLTDSTGTVVTEGDRFGSQVVSSFRIFSAAGIDDNSRDKAFTVFPNPVSDLINIEMNVTGPGSIQVELYNELGANVLHKEYTGVASGMNTLQISADQITPGIYVVKVTQGSKVYQAKISK
ncbi:MAG: T9SS type A sorting domain-containing protein [Bacteroidetes bacterium]|nr:T9SS type A sorting domain-containing protein [Bacteroidota bacterium]